jgi:hypothetical protein
MAAARFALIPLHEFDTLPLENQAEIIADFLTQKRIEEIVQWEQQEELRAIQTQSSNNED